MNKPIDLDAVVDRLREENSQDRKIISEIQILLRSEPELDGLSVLGGIKALLKLYKAQKKEIEELKYRALKGTK